MHPLHDYLFNLNRRQLLGGGLGFLGGVALAELSAAEQPTTDAIGLPRLPHHPPKARRVIHLFMEGGPSQLDTFDYKPELAAHFDEELPDSVRGGQRLTGMNSGQSRLPIAPSKFPFTRHANAEDGIWVSDLMRKTGEMAGEICVVKSMTTEQINHGPGITFMQTGHQIPGRPSVGAWLSYGLGIDHTRLTFRAQGLDFRLTGVEPSRVIDEILVG